MSPILINSTITSHSVPKTNNNVDEEKGEEETEKAREERKATGRSISIIIFLSLMCLALYHVIQKKTTILAGVLVPAMILFSYTFFVIHISNREKRRKRKQLERNELELSTTSLSDLKTSESDKKNLTPTANASASTSQTIAKTSKLNPIIDHARIPKTSNDLKLNAPIGNVKKIPPFKKIPSQSPVQVKSNQTTHVSVENEFKKLKKSRSFEKNINLESRKTPTDNKKIKTKH